jgi:hypothetical protein
MVSCILMNIWYNDMYMGGAITILSRSIRKILSKIECLYKHRFIDSKK